MYSSMVRDGSRILLGAIGCYLLAGCGTTMVGRLDGKLYVSKTGDITCTFPTFTRDFTFEDYSGNDGEWVSSNLSGVDIERVERYALGKGSIPAFKDVGALVDTILPRYTAISDRVKGTRVLVNKSVTIGTQSGIFTLVEFKTYTSENFPPNSLDYRGILWFVGEKYGTSMHVYNWRYTEKDAEKIESRLFTFYRNCRFRG